MITDSASLGSLRWHKRVIVITAPCADDPALVRQRALFHGHDDDLRERDLVVMTVIGGEVEVDGARAPDALPDPDLPTTFEVLLIGKDGGIKSRSAAPVDPDALFAQIDAMPMRQREMREA